MKRLRRLLLISAGFLCVFFGAVGLFFPLLPTTPFALLAAACFSSSSPRLFFWLSHTKYLGAYIENDRNKTGISASARIAGLLFLWIPLGISFVFVASPLARVILLLVGVGVTIHLCCLRSRACPMDDSLEVME